jgi:hypothetical protein
MGSGWVGWAPLGLYSQRGLTRPIMTIAGTAIQTGQIITPQNVGHAQFSEGTRTQQPPFQFGAGTPLSRAPLAAGIGTSLTAHPAGTHTLAPSSILMGGEGDKESALLGGHSSHQPLRVRLGTTLGGRYAVGGTVGEFRGDAFKGAGGMGGMNGAAYSRGNGQPRLSVLPHGKAGASSPSAGGAMAPAGAAGGMTGAGSARVTSTTTSHSTSSSTGGGHH